MRKFGADGAVGDAGAGDGSFTTQILARAAAKPRHTTASGDTAVARPRWVSVIDLPRWRSMTAPPSHDPGPPLADPSDSPWTTLTRTPVYDNPWIHVSHRDVVNPNGGVGIYGMIHFKSLAIGVLPVDADDHTWLVGQYRYATNEYSWEIPAGGGELDVDPEITARRELAEETGLVAAECRLLMEARTSNSVCDERAYVYVAEGLTEGETAPDDTELLEVRRLPVDDAIGMVLLGEITDSLSIMGLLRLAAERQAS